MRSAPAVALHDDDLVRAGVSTFVEVLAYRASDTPHAIAFRMLGDDGSERGSLTYHELEQRARGFAARLLTVAAPGDRVAVLLPPGLDFVVTIFGCLLAGVVAVPGYPPNPRRADARIPRMLENSGARVALVSAAARARIAQGDAPAVRRDAVWRDVVLVDVEPLMHEGDRAPLPAVQADTLALLQYTSGSTGEPRGVMLSHRQLVHNARTVRRVIGCDPGDPAVFWLPPFHDMGLIGGILQPVYTTLSVILMAPSTFMQRPARWLEAISRYRAVFSVAPNFAYDLCVDRISETERATLDLSSWRVGFNGAEPVRAETMRRFLDAFASAGLRRTMFMPSYGLAESTLFVAGGPTNQRPAARLIAGALRPSSGVPAESLQLAIVDPVTLAPRAAATEGEIWVQGDSVAMGYWNNAEATAAHFGATLPGVSGTFLRTGDLGLLADGELYVTGRLKDVVIVQGRNYYPQDIECAAERAHADLRPGYCAAFSVSAGTDAPERLMVVAEVDRHHAASKSAAVMQAMALAVVAEVGVRPDIIVLVPAHTLPRTSSGKLQRNIARDRGGRPAVQHLCAALATLPLSLIDRSASLRDHGLESIDVLRLQVALEHQVGHAVDAQQLWEADSLEAVVQLLTLTPSSRSAMPSIPVNADAARSDAASTDASRWPEVRAFEARRRALQGHGPTPFFTMIDGVAGAQCTVQGVRYDNFASYNYLGLSGHPRVTAAAQEAIARWGTSVSASRLVAGERAVHRTLECALAEFIGVDDAVAFVGGHATNVAVITHLVGAGDLVCCDERLHNSGMQGAQFSGARRVLFPHNDWRALDALLTSLRGQYRRVLVLIESVYSADGDVPDLAAFVGVKARHDALLMVDEAHGLGVLGASGRGVAEAAGVDPRAVDLWMGTLSKALASSGGYIAGNAQLMDYLRHSCPGFVFSVGLAPAVAAAAHEALLLLRHALCVCRGREWC